MAFLLSRAAPTASHHTRSNPLNPKTRKKTGHQITEPLDPLLYGFIPRRNPRPVCLEARRARYFLLLVFGLIAGCRLSSPVCHLSSSFTWSAIFRLSSSHPYPLPCGSSVLRSLILLLVPSLPFSLSRLSPLVSRSPSWVFPYFVVPHLIPRLAFFRLPISHPSPLVSRPPPLFFPSYVVLVRLASFVTRLSSLVLRVQSPILRPHIKTHPTQPTKTPSNVRTLKPKTQKTNLLPYAQAPLLPRCNVVTRRDPESGMKNPK